MDNTPSDFYIVFAERATGQVLTVEGEYWIDGVLYINSPFKWP